MAENAYTVFLNGIENSLKENNKKYLISNNLTIADICFFGELSQFLFYETKAMKYLGNASFSEEQIIAGENSAPGVISLISICEDKKKKDKVQLDKLSNILLIGCEGNTDQEMYQKLINQ